MFVGALMVAVYILEGGMRLKEGGRGGMLRERRMTESEKRCPRNLRGSLGIFSQSTNHEQRA